MEQAQLKLAGKAYWLALLCANTHNCCALSPDRATGCSGYLPVESEGGKRKGPERRRLEHRRLHLRRRSNRSGRSLRGRRLRLLRRLRGAPLGKALLRLRGAAHLRDRLAHRRRAELRDVLRLRRAADLADLVADGLELASAILRLADHRLTLAGPLGLVVALARALVHRRRRAELVGHLRRHDAGLLHANGLALEEGVIAAPERLRLLEAAGRQLTARGGGLDLRDEVRHDRGLRLEARLRGQVHVAVATVEERRNSAHIRGIRHDRRPLQR